MRRSRATRAGHWAVTVAACLMLLAAAAGCSSSKTTTGAAGSGNTGTVRSTGSPLPSRTQQQLRSTVGAKLRALKAPGAVVLAWTPHGTWTYTTGKADIGDGRPLTADEVFPIRSMTKSFTVTLVLQLADQGKLSLDDHIDKYVPGIQDGDKVTLRQLAAMTSGLPDYTNEKWAADFQQDMAKTYTPQELVGFIKGEPMAFPPGTKAAYCNVNTVLLGMVVEKVTGKPFAQVLTDQITGPLGLKHTEFLTTVDYPQPHPVAYSFDDETRKLEPNPPSSLSIYSFAGGMVSTAADLRGWVMALASGKLLKPATQAERVDAAQKLTKGPEYDRYGLGIGEIDGWWGHTGNAFGITTAGLADPAGTEGVVILLNSDNDPDGPAHLAQQLIPILKKAA